MIAQSFTPEVYTSRLSRARQLLLEHKLAAAIIGPGSEFAYLTGCWASSHERLTALLITPQAAAIIAPSTDAFQFKSLGLPVRGWDDGENAYALVSEVLSESLTDAAPSASIAVGSELTADHLLALRSRLSAQFVLATDVLVELFGPKEPAELDQLRFAGEAIDEVHRQVPELLRSGRTEAEVAADISELILAQHEVVDFIIVGSGPNGANPHHSYSDRVLEAGDPVVVDIGGTVGVGYHSDCTRTFVVPGAPAPAEFLRAYEVLYRAQETAVQSVRPGVSAQQVDAAARDVIAAEGWGEYFTHRTGHGIGLSVHEQPYIIAGNELQLQPGMTFSVEPGIYVPGQWGMRIEDIVAVTETGAERLNNTSRRLVES